MPPPELTMSETGADLAFSRLVNYLVKMRYVSNSRFRFKS